MPYSLMVYQHFFFIYLVCRTQAVLFKTMKSLNSISIQPVNTTIQKLDGISHIIKKFCLLPLQRFGFLCYCQTAIIPWR